MAKKRKNNIAKAFGVAVAAAALFLLLSETPGFGLAAFAATKAAGCALLVVGSKIVEAADPSIAEEEV